MKKKNKKQKKQKKQNKRPAPRAVKHEIVLKVQSVTPPPSLPAVKESDLLPEKEGSKYMIPKTWMSEKQVVRMVQATPKQHVYNRPAKGGGTWSYVTGAYVEKVLNFTFGWNWDFEVIGHGKEQDQVWVLGKLTVKDDKGHQITKTQFGRADVKYKKNSKDMLDFGNDLKAASTDALKKCASLLGIASDIYGKMEFKQEAGVDVQNTNTLPPPKTETKEVKTELKPGQVIGPDGQPTYVCSSCSDPISQQVADYSLKMFGKRLCREHQTKK